MSLLIYKMAGVAAQRSRYFLCWLHRPALDLAALGRRMGRTSVVDEVANVRRKANGFNEAQPSSPTILRTRWRGALV